MVPRCRLTLLPALLLTAVATAASPAEPVRVALYTGPGASASRDNVVAGLSASPRMEVADITAAEIRGGRLTGFDVVVFPGGTGGGQGRALEPEGRDAVREFVRAGGGYLGICAGAYLATCDYDWSLGILDAKVIDKQHWARGYGEVQLDLTPPGRDALGIAAERTAIYYHQGPLLAPAGDSALPDYQPLAAFATEVTRTGVSGGMMCGTDAIVSGRFGDGRVICFSPHPEKWEPLRPMLVRGALWAAGDADSGTWPAVAAIATAPPTEAPAKTPPAPIADEAPAVAPPLHTEAPPQTGPETRVAIYDHSGGTAKGPVSLGKLLTGPAGFVARRVTPADIRNGVLAGYDVLIMPGGSGSKQAAKLGPEGRETIIKFVRDGGGYVGICAGSYLASSHYDWSLHLLNAKVVDREHWARGTGQVRIGMTPAGRAALGESAEEVEVYYGQGPLLAADEQADLPAYEPLACYVTEIAEKGAPKGVMPGTTAIARAGFGDGRVICFSPHPEVGGGPNHLILAGVRWATKTNAAPPSQ